MDIYRALVEKAQPFARAKRTKRVCVGICYTFVEIERGGGTGLAYTPVEELKTTCGINEDLNFWKAPADLLIKNYLSPNLLESAIGLATINAVFSNKKTLWKHAVSGDVFSQIELSSKDEVLMIGYFESILKKLEGIADYLWIIGKDWMEKEYTISEIAKKVKLVIITGASLVDKSLDLILKKVEDVREVLLMGPSVPLNPEVFKFTPITWLCGSIVKNSEFLFRKVCEGKGTRIFFKQGLLEKVNLRVKK